MSKIHEVLNGAGVTDIDLDRCTRYLTDFGCKEAEVYRLGDNSFAVGDQNVFIKVFEGIVFLSPEDEYDILKRAFPNEQSDIWFGVCVSWDKAKEMVGNHE